MFTWRHFVWLGICAIIATCLILVYSKRRPPLTKVLNTAIIVSILSETVKVFSVIIFVPSSSGDSFTPYMPLNHLPLHFCSIQILFILFVRFTSNAKWRENLLAFMYPTCAGGAVSALLMPSIFTTSTPVEKAFVSPMCYQFFLFHTMLFVLAVIIVKSGEVKWKAVHLHNSLILIYVMGFISLYINSVFASPTYKDGELVSVDFVTNYFFTYKNPINLKLTAIWQWYIYLLILIAFTGIMVVLMYLPLIIKSKKKTASPEEKRS